MGKKNFEIIYWPLDLTTNLQGEDYVLVLQMEIIELLIFG